MGVNKLKYWLLTSEYPPFYGGGVSTYCYHTAQMLQSNGHEVSVFIYDNAINTREITIKDGVRVVRFSPCITKTRAFLGYSAHLSYEYAAIVKEYVENEGCPDVIESQEYLGIAYYLLQYRWLGYDWCKGLKILITAHSPAFLYLPQNHISIYKYPLFWIAEMERFCLKAADAVISPTRFLLAEIEKDTPLSNVPVKVVPNPFIQTRQSDPEQPEGFRIVLLAKLSVQKGTFHVLKYMEQIWQSHPEIEITLIGDDSIVYHPEQKTMGDLVRRRYADAIANGRLHLRQKLPPNEYVEALKDAALVLVPSTFDNLPYVVLEMMSLGKIVLASRQGGQSEIITDGVDGFLFDHNEKEDFATRLLHILHLPLSEKKRIAVAAQVKVKAKFGADTIYAQKLTVLNSLRSRSEHTSIFPFVRLGFGAEPAAKDDGSNGLLSVVVTFYNSGKYLKNVLSNLQAIDYPNVEIIIINDGSTETESIQLLNELGNEENIRVIHQENRGLAASRNRGASEARGRYLAFLDADDEVAPNYYSKAVTVLKRYSTVHYVGCWTQYFEDSQKQWPAFQPEPPLSLYHNTINSAALVFQRSSFLEAGGNDTEMVFAGLEDYEMLIKMAAKGMGGVVLPEILFRYRVRRDSMVKGLNPYKRRLIGEYIRKKHSPLYGQFACELLNLAEMNGPAHILDNPSLDYDFADKLPVGGKLAMRMARYIKRNKYLRPVAYRIYRMIN